MSEFTSPQKTNSTTQLVRNDKSVSSRETVAERLRRKIRNFALRDRRGDLIGEVRDLIPDSGSDKNFRLVISRPDTHKGVRFFLLDSKHLYKVDNSARSLFTSLEKSDIDQLLEYNFTNRADSRIADPILIPEPPFQTSSNSLATTNPMPETTSQLNSVDNTNPVVHSEAEVSHEVESASYVDAQPGLEPVVSEPIAAHANTQHMIQLLEERLTVDRHKRKVGEIVVRKEIETRIVEVPVRREKLIVDQVGSETKRLAEIDISSGEVTGVELTKLVNSLSDRPLVEGTFSSLKTVSQLLDVLTRTVHYQCNQVTIELVLENHKNEKTLHQFESLGAAVIILDALAHTLTQACREIHVRVSLVDQEAQPIYQKWFDYYKRF